MVVLMESPGQTLKRKGAEEPGLYPGDGDPAGFLLTCRATKIRRLVSADHHHDVSAPPAVASVGTGGDVMMGEAPSPAVADEEGAVVVYDPAGTARGLLGQWRLRPWAPLRAGAEWIRDMLREAGIQTVREMLTGAQEESADMAIVPWGAATAPAATGESTAEEAVDGEDIVGTAAMEVEEERGHQRQTFGAGCGEGYLYRWPQHCMVAPPQLPAVGQASAVMWSW